MFPLALAALSLHGSVLKGCVSAVQQVVHLHTKLAKPESTQTPTHTFLPTSYLNGKKTRVMCFLVRAAKEDFHDP